MSETVIDTAFLPPKAEGTLRLVTNNILQQTINNSRQRLLGLIEAYKIYEADIAAFQEVDVPWREEYHIVDEMAKIGYALASETGKLHTPIYFKADKFTLIENGYVGYDLRGLAEQSVRAYCWACLEEKASGKRFIVTNTHLISVGNGMSDEAKENRELHRQRCARQFPAALSALCERFGNVPALSTGDFNSYCITEPYKILAEALNSAREVCPSRVNMEYRTSCSVGKPPVLEEGMAIDHVFFTKYGVTPVHFETVIDPFTYSYTDHVPVFFDFYLD